MSEKIKSGKYPDVENITLPQENKSITNNTSAQSTQDSALCMSSLDRQWFFITKADAQNLPIEGIGLSHEGFASPVCNDLIYKVVNPEVREVSITKTPTYNSKIMRCIAEYIIKNSISSLRRENLKNAIILDDDTYNKVKKNILLDTNDRKELLNDDGLPFIVFADRDKRWLLIASIRIYESVSYVDECVYITPHNNIGELKSFLAWERSEPTRANQ